MTRTEYMELSREAVARYECLRYTLQQNADIVFVVSRDVYQAMVGYEPVNAQVNFATDAAGNTAEYMGVPLCCINEDAEEFFMPVVYSQHFNHHNGVQVGDYVLFNDESDFSPLLCDDFWYSVMPIAGASDALQQLIADGHRVLIVTTSAYQTLRTKMEVVLFGYFPFLSWSDVIITSHKQLIKGDVLVDDGVHNLEGGEYFKVLMDAPHNRNYDAAANNMVRVRNWGEAYSVITNLANTVG